MIIALDGPAGAGKSTVARAVADRLNLTFLDTGAMYRGLTLAALQRGLDPLDEAACVQLANELELSFGEDGLVRIDGQAGEPDIRSATVTLTVSTVSAYRGVRDAVVSKQREIGLSVPGLVVEGRDTTTVVFPEAEYKFFLVASPTERARRRAAQEDREDEVDMILRDIERRDQLDTTRAHAPLRQAEDAILIDTDSRNIDSVVEEILACVGEPGATGSSDEASAGV